MFFLIYINDLTRYSNFDVTLYAYDSVLTLAHKDVLSLQNNVNHELLKIDEWLRINKLTVNLDKTNFLLFSNCSRPPKFNISFGGSSIKQCDSVKYLGVYLDDKLNWNRHVGYVITKLSSAFVIFYKLRNLLPINILISVHYSIVYSHLQYAVISWGNCSVTLRKRLQIKQNSIICIINKSRIYKTKLKPLFEKMNLLNISAIYELEVGKFMAKLQNKQLPDYFNSLFSLTSSFYSYSTRSVANEKFFFNRSYLIKTERSIKIAGPKISNNLPKTIKEKSEKVKSFKSSFKKYLLSAQEFS